MNDLIETTKAIAVLMGLILIVVIGVRKLYWGIQHHHPSPQQSISNALVLNVGAILLACVCLLSTLAGKKPLEWPYVSMIFSLIGVSSAEIVTALKAFQK